MSWKLIFTPNTDFDVIVVGGRPAGATLAAYLGKQKLRVLLLERATFPSLPAVSSPIIYAPVLQMLDEIGAREDEYARDTPKIRRMVNVMGDGLTFPIPIPDYKGRDYAYAVDRARFDAALWDAALRFPTVTGYQNFSVTDLLMDGGRVIGVVGTDAHKQTRCFTAPLVVGADGRFSLVARKMNAKARDEHNDLPTTIYYAYWRGVTPIDADGPTASTYGITPGVGYLVMDSADDTAAVCIEGRSELLDETDSDTEGFYLKLLRGNPLLWERLQSAERVTTVRGMKRIRNLYRDAGGDGWALVGDAYHQKDPLDGQGIYNAVFSAKALADAIKRYRAGELLTWDAALAWYDETVRIRTYSMYRALLGRVQATLYAPQPPEWVMHSAVRWVMNDDQMQQFVGKFMTRQIPTDVANLLLPPVAVSALVRGGLRDLRDRVRQRLNLS